MPFESLVQGENGDKGTLPSAQSVMERVMERAKADDKNEAETKYSFEKQTITQELDAWGKVTKTTRKTFSVFPIDGEPYLRLIKIQDRNLTAKELEDEDRKEEQFRRKMGARNAVAGTNTNGNWLDKSVVDRFVFDVKGREMVADRSAFVLSFHPKPGQPEKTAGDKILDRLGGELWVDEKDWEIARLKVGLSKELSLGWFGMIGSLKELEIDLEQIRVADGAWLARKQTVLLAGRKVFSSMRFRTIEECSKFLKSGDVLGH